MCAAIGIVRQKMRDAKIQHTLFGRREGANNPSENLWGVMLGEAKREAPAQAELRPTCAGPSRVKLPPYFNP
jgi:hypothetical protein